MSAIHSGMLATGMVGPERKRSSAVRCLFPIDDNDREKLNQELDNQARQIDEAETKRFTQKWGFDPVRGVPSAEDSAFEYSVLDGRSVPSVYTSTYRHRLPRPVSRVRSLYQARHLHVGRPVKRKLRFEGSDSKSNDENRQVSDEDIAPVKHARVDDVFVTDESTINNSFSLSSPPASPPASSLQQSAPLSPSVLSSSCPAIIESHPRLSPEVPGVERSLSLSEFELSPGQQARDYITPGLRPKSGKLVQREITDYGSIRKKSSTKGTPRS